MEQHSSDKTDNASPQTDDDVWTEFKSPISLIHEIAVKNNLNVRFVVLSDMDIFLTKCRVGDLPITVGEGNGKKISKKRAAEKMLEEFSKLGLLTNTTNKVSMKRKGNLIKVDSERNSDYAEKMDPISRLNQIQQANKEKGTVYNVIEERGTKNNPEFVIEALVHGHISTGVGPNKKIAKRNAAEALLTLLGYTNSHAPQSASKPVIKTKGKLGSSEILNSGSSSAPVEAKKSGQAQAPKSTTPPQIYHGEGPTTETSHEKAALKALNVLFELGLDSVTPNKENVHSVPQVVPKAELNKNGIKK